MIRNPQPGQRVRIHYAKRYAGRMPHHGQTGVVVTAGRGPGPRNVLVALDGTRVVVPCGNLEEEQCG